jgi:hypothetical protein
MLRAWIIGGVLGGLALLPVPNDAQAAVGRNVVEAGCHRHIPKDPIDDTFKGSVFKVYVKMSDGSKADIGTATLIDERGYFLSASHTTHRIHNWPPEAKDIDWLSPFPKTLVLWSDYGGELELEAFEIVHGNPDRGWDYNLLKAKLPSEQEKLHRRAVDPLPMTSPTDGMRMYGYPAQSTDLYLTTTDGAYQVNLDTDVIKAIGEAYGGQSGSLIIGLHGKALGVLSGRRKEAVGSDERDVTLFSPTYRALDLLGRVPLSNAAKEIVEQIESGQTSILLHQPTLRMMDAIGILHYLTRNQASMKDKMPKFTFWLQKILNNMGLCVDAAWLVTTFPMDDIAGYRRVELGRNALRAAKGIRLAGGIRGSAPIKEAKRVAGYAAGILGDVIKAQRSISYILATEDLRNYWAGVNYDYALAIYSAGAEKPSDKVAVIAALRESLDIKPDDPNAWELASVVLKDAKLWDAAAAATASAHVNAKTQFAKSRLERDWRFYGSKSLASENGEPEIKSFGDWYSPKIAVPEAISAAPKLSVDELKLYQNYLGSGHID